MRGLERERKWRRQRRFTAALAITVLVGCLAATADAIRMQVGDIVIHGDGRVIPSELPKDRNAPVRFKMHAKVSTDSGVLPPIFKRIKLKVDGHGYIETRGLPICKFERLTATTVKEARKRCGGAIVATGSGRGVVAFPDSRPIDVTSPVTFFNGPHSKGRWTLLGHAFIAIPAPAAILFAVKIKKIDDGPFGYLVEAELPPIAGGHGIPLAAEIEVGRNWTHKGERLSYLNGRCANGKVRAFGEFEFKDGTLVLGSFLKPCSVRP